MSTQHASEPAPTPGDRPGALGDGLEGLDPSSAPALEPAAWLLDDADASGRALSERPTIPVGPSPESLRPTLPAPANARAPEGDVPARPAAPDPSSPRGAAKRPPRLGLAIAFSGAVLCGVVVAAAVAPALLGVPDTPPDARAEDGEPAPEGSAPAAAAAERAAPPGPEEHVARPGPAGGEAEAAAPSSPRRVARAQARRGARLGDSRPVPRPDFDGPVDHRMEPVVMATPDAPRGHGLRPPAGLERRPAARAVREPAVRERAVRRGRARSDEAEAPLSAEAVRPVIEAGRYRLRQCYQTAVRRAGRGRDARVTLILHVAPDGSVGRVDVEGSDFAGLADCLRSTARRFDFPASRGGGRVPVPLAFDAAG
jgi:hypothetical protein